MESILLLNQLLVNNSLGESLELTENALCAALLTFSTTNYDSSDLQTENALLHTIALISISEFYNSRRVQIVVEGLQFLIANNILKRASSIDTSSSSRITQEYKDKRYVSRYYNMFEDSKGSEV